MMDYGIFLGIMNLILLSRLRLILRDEGITSRDMLLMGALPLLAMPFLEVNLAWFLLLIYLLAYPPLMLVIERSGNTLNRNRALVLLLHFVAVGFLCSPLLELSVGPFLDSVLTFIDGVMLPSSTIQPAAVDVIQLVLFGFLLVLNEINIILRYVLQLIGLESLGTQGEEVDQKEYNTGRVIGLLERIFVFLFVLLNQYTAIGFILAAKGVARFQDFKSRTFAEYVLIGTLLSALLAMAVAFVVKGLLFL